MLDLPENELFSAYIDGELTAEEQADVEQILNDNPEARQLVDELRSLSSSLQSLPAYKLDEDLASRVLRQAEREMLAEPAAPLPKFHQVDVPGVKPTSWARRLLRPRNFAWSAVAIAVAVILMVDESDTNNGAANQLADDSKGVLIKPLDVVPTVEAVKAPPIPTVAHTATPEEAKDEPKPEVPEVVAPAREPTMIADTPPDANPEPNKQPAEPKAETDPLLVLQCQLAEGRIGHEALAELLGEAGVALEKPIAEDGSPAEFTLTTNEFRQVISLLQADTERFSGFSVLSTAKTAAPRIPSPVGPGSLNHQESTAAEGSNAKKSPKATFRMQGTFTLQPNAAPRANPAETTSVDGSPSRAKATTKAVPLKTPKSLPVKDDRNYRVRFVLRAAEKAAEVKPAADK